MTSGVIASHATPPPLVTLRKVSQACGPFLAHTVTPIDHLQAEPTALGGERASKLVAMVSKGNKVVPRETRASATKRTVNPEPSSQIQVSTALRANPHRSTRLLHCPPTRTLTLVRRVGLVPQVGAKKPKHVTTVFQVKLEDEPRFPKRQLHQISSHHVVAPACPEPLSPAPGDGRARRVDVHKSHARPSGFRVEHLRERNGHELAALHRNHGGIAAR